MNHTPVPGEKYPDSIGGARQLRGAFQPWAVAALVLGELLTGPAAAQRTTTEISPVSPETSQRRSASESSVAPFPAAPAVEPPRRSLPAETRPKEADWDLVAGLEGDALLSKAAGFGLLDANLQSLHRSILRDRRSVKELAASGLGENHPDVRGLNADVETHRRQLLAAVTQLQQNAETARKLTTAQAAASAIPVIHLSPDQSSRLRWGKPSNGLRLALTRPESVGEKHTGSAFDFRMLIENVSEEAIQIDMALLADQSPRLKVRREGRTLAAFTGAPHPSRKIMLPSGAIASVPVFRDRLHVPSIQLFDPSLALSVDLELVPSSGHWSGRLACPDTFGLFSEP